MKNTSILTKLGAAVATLFAPATLFLGAGTAHASVAVNVNPAPGGVDVWLTTSPDNPADTAPSGWCTYNSSVAGNPWGKPAPAINVPFYLPPNPPGQPSNSRLAFPSYPTGSTWNITVECPNGVASTQTVW